MVFGFNLSFGIWAGDDERSKKSRNYGDLNVGHPATSNTQVASVKQTRRGISKERAARVQRQRELRADRESLRQLEMATAPKSRGKARLLDRESLAVLEEAAQGEDLDNPRTDTPSSAWNYPIIHKLKGIGSDPGRYEPSISSRPPPSSSSAPSKERARAGQCSGAVAKDGLRAELGAAGWSTGSIEDLIKSQDHDETDQRDSVHKWFDRLEEREAEPGLEGMDDAMSGSVGSTPSSSSDTQSSDQASKKYGKLISHEPRTHGAGGDGAGAGEARLRPNSSRNGQRAGDEAEDNESDAEDWVSLDYVSDES